MLIKKSKVLHLDDNYIQIKVTREDSASAILKEYHIKKALFQQWLTQCSPRLKPDQTLSFSFPKEEIEYPVSQRDIPVVYEDALCLIADKPAFLLVHDDGNDSENLQDHLMGQLHPSHPIQCVHRIDTQTSGLVLFNKLPVFQGLLDTMMETHQIRKEYLCIVEGSFPTATKTIREPLGRDRHNAKKMRIHPNGKPAVTHITRLETNEYFSLLKVQIETGRKHQIRVHLASMGYPIVNDDLYGHVLNSEGLLLQSHRLSFSHPLWNQEVDVCSKKDARFSTIWEYR